MYSRSCLYSNRRVVAPLAFLTVLSGALVGQTFRGAIAGSVVDTSGAAVPDAQVKIVHKGTALTRIQNTPSVGEFSFPELPTGIYTTTVTKEGFQPFKQDIEVAVGKISSLPVTLSVAAQSQTVEVQAAAATLETSEAALNAVVSTRPVQELPLNGRDFRQLLQLTPGFNAGTSMNGSRNTQNNYQLDGVDNNDLWGNEVSVNQTQVGGTPAVLLPVDAIDQFNQQAGGNADFGRDAGSMVNVVIKSGTNELHGSAYYFNRNEALASHNPFAPPNQAKPKLRNENLGFSLGGPILKNKTFFFLTYEKQRLTAGQSLQATVPSSAWIAQATTVLTKYGVQVNPVMITVFNALWPSSIQDAPAALPNFFSPAKATWRNNDGIIKFDHAFNDRHSFFAHVFVGDGEDTAFGTGTVGGTAGNVSTGSVYPNFFQTVPARQWSVAGVWNAVFTPRLVNQLLLGVNYLFASFSDVNSSYNMPSLGFNTGVTNPADFGAPKIDITGFTNGGVGPTAPIGRIDTTGHLTDSLSYQMGSHALKFGGEIRKQRLDAFYKQGSRGQFTFDGTAGPWASDNSFSTPQKALADFLAGLIGPAHASIATGDPQRVYNVNSFAAWAADNWQVTPKLNLNLGLRYTYNSPVSEVGDKGISTFLPTAPGGLALVGQGISSLYPPDKTRVDPRIGLAYAPKRGGKTVIRAGWGIYSDIINASLFVDNMAGSDTGRGIARNPIGGAPVYSVTAGPLVVQKGVPIFGTTAAPPFGVYGVNQNLRAPYVQNFNVNVQQQLTRFTLLQIGYVGSQARKLPVTTNINQPLPDPTGLLSQQQRRPYNTQFPQIAGITELATAGNSQYNSMQVSLRNTSWRGLTGQLSYTLSHARDNMSSARNNHPQDNYNLKGDYGNSDFDTRHNVSGFLLYDVPNFAKSVPRLGKGWQVNVLILHNSGFPFTAVAGQNISNSFSFNDRANLVGDPFSGIVQPSNVAGNYANGYRWFNPAAFALPAKGSFGNTHRNQFYGPHFNTTDFSIFKNTPITERISAQLRVEFFNLFNQLNLGNPNTSLGAGSSMGLIFGTKNSGIGAGVARNTQLALKIIW